MRRREFITALGGAAAWPLAAHAQQSAVPVIGFLSSETPDLFESRVRAFRQGLSETGHIEGRNVAIQYRWAGGQNDRLPSLAGDLVQRQVHVIFTSGNAAVLAAKSATPMIPIVFFTGSDPVELGLIARLNRPGGNLAGVTTLGVELGPKQLELLRELVPAAASVALLVNPTNPSIAEAQSRDVQAAARALGLQLHVLHASTEHDLDTAIAALARARVGALLIGTDVFFNTRNEQIVALAASHAVPTIYPYREGAAAGGLMSYGGSFTDQYRTAGIYTGRILKGEKPADLPVQQATKVGLVINLKAAKAIGVSIPLSVRVRADEVIE